MNGEAAETGLRQLIWEWDPIGVADIAPGDEYDCLIQPLLRRLHDGADRSAISTYLREELTEHFGLNLAHHATDAVADRIVTWWARAASTLMDPDASTPCPACGTGVEQASDPGHLFRSVCYCGHPRYYDYRHRDGTCPCQSPSL